MKKILLFALGLALSASAQKPPLDSKSFAGLEGDPVRARLSEPAVPGILERVGHVASNDWGTTYGPTGTHRASLAVAEEDLAEARAALERLVGTELEELDEALERAGAPWTKGAETVNRCSVVGTCPSPGRGSRPFNTW